MRAPVAFLLAVLLTLVPLSGCKNGGDNDATTVRVGVALYQQDDTFIATIAQNLEQRSKEKEQQRGVKINLSITDSRGSQAAQNEQVDRFLAQGYDVLCINMVDRTAASVIIDKCQVANVPVIFFNREPVEEDLLRWEGAYYVGSQAAQSGTMQGQIVRNAWRRDRERWDKNKDGVLQYVLLEGEQGHQDTLLRTEYSVKELTLSGIQTEKLANDTASWQRGTAMSLMDQWIREFGRDIEVVLANNDDMALGAIDACLSYKMDEETMPLIVGVDATPPALEALQLGTLAGTVKNDAQAQAQTIVDLALALALKESSEAAVEFTSTRTVLLPYVVVLK